MLWLWTHVAEFGKDSGPTDLDVRGKRTRFVPEGAIQSDEVAKGCTLWLAPSDNALGFNTLYTALGHANDQSELQRLFGVVDGISKPKSVAYRVFATDY